MKSLGTVCYRRSPSSSSPLECSSSSAAQCIPDTGTETASAVSSHGPVCKCTTAPPSETTGTSYGETSRESAAPGGTASGGSKRRVPYTAHESS